MCLKVATSSLAWWPTIPSYSTTNQTVVERAAIYTNIYCYSNSTLINTAASIVFPDGQSYTTDSVISGVNRVEVLESALHLVVVSNGEGSNINNGIFTFVIPDANGNLIHLNLGLYRFNSGTLSAMHIK